MWFLYIEKQNSNMTCPSQWDSDIVYSDHTVRMHAFRKHFPRFDSKIPHVERNRNLSRKEDIKGRQHQIGR